MIENLDQFIDRYSTTLRKYEKVVSTANSIPFMISNLKAKQNWYKQKDKAMSLRKRLLFNQNFLDLAKKYSNQLSISPYTSTTENTLKLRSYIKDPKNISSEMYFINPIRKETNNNNVTSSISAIFSLDYKWKREKQKYKPKEYTFRVGRKQHLDIKNYTPNYDYIYKKVPHVKISPLPVPIIQKKKEDDSSMLATQQIKCKKFAKIYKMNKSETKHFSTQSNIKYIQTTPNGSNYSFRA